MLILCIPVGVAGFDVNDVTVFEADGVATHTVRLLSPDQVSPDVQVELSLSTADNTALGKHVYPHHPCPMIMICRTNAIKSNNLFHFDL